ncbi:MAG TPA: hypothetical protein PLL01_03745 [Rhodoferax sp.]|jgi:hypothetical protein|nr:hypothetical protein [Rhodoferax sp.]
MQIDRFSHLQFPRHSMPNASENESSGVPPRAGLSKPPAQLPVPVADGILVRPDSVVMKVQLPENASARASVAVYSDSRKPVSAGDTKADAETQAADHQCAIDRNAGVYTQITLNKDGVLVAKSQMAGASKQPDFVALAVSAMREFSDEAERQKTQSIGAAASAVERPWGGLKGLQHLAAKFKVFA